MPEIETFYTFSDGEDEPGGFECVARFESADALHKFMEECSAENLAADEDDDSADCRFFRVTVEEILRNPQTATEVPQSDAGGNGEGAPAEEHRKP